MRGPAGSHAAREVHYPRWGRVRVRVRVRGCRGEVPCQSRAIHERQTRVNPLQGSGNVVVRVFTRPPPLLLPILAFSPFSRLPLSPTSRPPFSLATLVRLVRDICSLGIHRRGGRRNRRGPWSRRSRRRRRRPLPRPCPLVVVPYNPLPLSTPRRRRPLFIHHERPVRLLDLVREAF